MKYTRNGQIIDTSNSWNEKTGQLVLDIISLALDSVVTDVVFDTSGDDPEGVPFQIFKGGETEVPSSEGKISVIQPSEYEIELTYSDVPSFIDNKTNLVINYSYKFKNKGSAVYIGNAVSTFNVKINGALSFTLNTLGSYSTNAARNGTITIPKSSLNIGANIIDISCSSQYGGGSTIAAQRLYSTVNVLDLYLDVNLSGDEEDFYKKPITHSLDLTFTFSVNGWTQLPSYLTGNDKFKICVWLNDSTANPVVEHTSLSSLLRSIDLIRGTLAYSAGILILYFQVVCDNGVDGYNSIKSNVIQFRLLGLDNNGLLSGVLLASKLSLESLPMPNAIYKTSLYLTNRFKFYVCNFETTPITIEHSIDGEKLGDKQISGRNNNDTYYITDYPVVKSFELNGDHTLSIVTENNDNIFTLLINVTASDALFVYPTTNMLVSLKSAEKIENSSDSEWSSGNYSCLFENFDWRGNGWHDGGLLVNQGATVTLDCPICSNSTYSASFKIKTVNAIEENEELITCIDRRIGTDDQGNEVDMSIGFIIYPNRFKAMPYGGANLTCNFSTNNEHEITFVRYGSGYKNLYVVYIDGVIAKVSLVSTTSTHSNPIVISSTKTQLYVYDINLYSRALSFSEVLSLYGYHKTSVEDMTEYFNSNSIFSSNNTINTIGYHGDKVTIDSVPVGSSYMLISAYRTWNSIQNKFESLEPTPWETINKYPGVTQEEADKYKGIRHLIGSIKYVKKTGDPTQPDTSNFFVVGGTLYAQGTSSMAYPLKNFRIAFKKALDVSDEQVPYYNSTPIYSEDGEAGDIGYSTAIYTGISEDFSYDYRTKQVSGTSTGSKVTLENATAPQSIKYSLYREGEDNYTHTSAPANIFCLKADYAESSGTHNTGFARFVDNFLKTSGDVRGDDTYSTFRQDGDTTLTPQQRMLNTYQYDIRTTIDGKPLYLFFEDAEGNIYYHGKYNLNNEKSSEEVFGFLGLDDYYSNETVRTEGDRLTTAFNAIYGNRNYFKDTHATYNIEDGKMKTKKDGSGTYVNPTECWEFSKNEFTTTEGLTKYLNNVGAFLYPYPVNSSYPLYSLYPSLNPFTAKSDNKLVWLNQAWEYRFPDLTKYKYTETVNGSTILTKADVIYQGANGEYYRRPFLLESLYKWIYKHNITLVNNKETVANEFAYQLSYYFNVNYLLKYYVLTKFFAAVDQRVKNCMLSFYCEPQAANNIDAIDPQSPMGHMRAFYIFYDNDTIMGLINDGSMKWDWNVDEGEAFAGNGVHGLWDTLEYCLNLYLDVECKIARESESNRYACKLGSFIKNTYNLLESYVRLTNNSPFIHYFESLCTSFPDSAYNVDAQVKYFYPAKLRGEQDSSNYAIANNLLKEQGNRKAHRDNWISRRKSWYDNMFACGDYSTYIYGFKMSGTSSATNADSTVKLRTGLDKFKFYTATGNDVFVSKFAYVNDANPITLTIPSSSISDSVNIQGLYSCSELDLSGFYSSASSYLSTNDSMSELRPLLYLKKLTFNTTAGDRLQLSFYIGTNIFPLLVSETLTPNLEECYIANCAPGDGNAFGILDLSGLSLLRILDATNTPITEIILPNGSSLTTLSIHQPSKLNITNKPNLQTMNISSLLLLTDLEIGTNNSLRIYDYFFTNIYSLVTTLNNNLLKNLVLRFSDDINHPTVISNTNGAVTALINLAKYKLNIPTYSATQTYSVGDKVLVGNTIYTCNTEITSQTVGAWNDNKSKFTEGVTFTVTGYLYSEILGDDADTNALRIAFTNLKISSTSGQVALQTGGKIELLEGDSITFSVTGTLVKKNDWNILVNGQSYTNNTLDGKLTFTFDGDQSLNNPDTSKVTINAARVSSNISLTVPLEVSVPDNAGEGRVKKTVTIKYIPVTGIEINSRNNKDLILGSGNSCSIVLNNTTEGIKDNDIVVKLLPINNTKNLSISDLTIKLDGNIVLSSIVTMPGQNSHDILVNVSVYDIDPAGQGKTPKNELTVYYDDDFNGLLTLTTVLNNTGWMWIYELLKTLRPNDYTTLLSITRSVLNSITVQSSHLVGSNRIISIQDQNSAKIIPDFTYLQYVNWSGEFVIPNYAFINLNIPNVTSVTWTSYDSSYTYGSFINFPSKMRLCIINLSGLRTLLSALELNFERCTNITSFVGTVRPSNISDNYISMNLVYDNPGLVDDSWNIITNDSLSLPRTISTIGYYDLNQSEYPSAGKTMFNISGVTIEDSGRYTPAFNIPGISRLVNLGAVYGYRTTFADVSESCIGLLNSGYQSNISNISHTCKYFTCLYSGCNLLLSNVSNIGDYTFYNSGSEQLGTIILHSQVLETLGNNVFGPAKVTVVSDILQSENVLRGGNNQSISFNEFAILKTIGDSCFTGSEQTINWMITSSEFRHIGGYTFLLANTNQVGHNIYLNIENPDFTIELTAFGATTNPVSYLFVNHACMQELQGNSGYSTLASRVNIVEIDE